MCRMANNQWGVSSEVGRLRAVLVHQPGYEHRQTVPWNKDALLFDDILDVEEARPQHKTFTHLLSDHGASVLYLDDLLKHVWNQPGGAERIADEVLGGDIVRAVGLDRLRSHHLIAGYPDHYTLEPGVSFAPLPNLYFTRDPAFAVPGALVVSHPAKPARLREARLVRAVLRHHPLFAGATLWDGLLEDAGATLEGGDVLIASDETVLVGVGERTNDRGARMLADYLFEHTPVRQVLLVHIPAKREFMHLDTVLTFVDRRRIITLPFLWDRPQVYVEVAERSKRECAALGFDYRGPDPAALAEASWLDRLTPDGREESFDDTLDGLSRLGVIDRDATLYVAGVLGQYDRPEEHVVEALREQWNDGANTLALKPGQVMGYRSNDRTFRALEENGVEVVAFPGGELVRGRGGARCMSMPLRRDGI
jgi:arginine deiminase